MKAGYFKGFCNEHRDNLRNLKDFIALEYSSSQMKLRIKLICILSQKSTDIVLGELQTLETKRYYYYRITNYWNIGTLPKELELSHVMC